MTSFFCFPQPGTSTTLDPLREVVMWRLQYRNFGSYETLVGNLVTDIDGNDTGGIRWFELRKSGAGNWSLFQEGTYAPADGETALWAVSPWMATETSLWATMSPAQTPSRVIAKSAGWTAMLPV